MACSSQKLGNAQRLACRRANRNGGVCFHTTEENTPAPRPLVQKLSKRRLTLLAGSQVLYRHLAVALQYECLAGVAAVGGL